MISDIRPSSPGVGRTRWRRTVLVLGIVAVVLWAATRTTGGFTYTPNQPARPTPPPGELTTLTADEFDGVLVGLRGRPVIVNVWASWCAPCRAEMPLLQRTASSGRGDVVILGVASKDSRGPAGEFMEEFGVTYPNVFDQSGEIRRRLRLRGFPTTYVFASDGVLRSTIVGGLTEQRLAAIIADVTS